METQQKSSHFDPQTLAQRVASLEATVAQNENLLQEKESVISKLTAELNAEKFKYAQLQRMIFGSKRERFVPTFNAQQLQLELEPKTIEIEQAVEAERESLRITYERKKIRKPHPGRMPLPSHLPVVEIVIEPEGSSLILR